jgi:hypothetical protein
MAGWIKVFRSLLDWEWYKKPNMVHLFIHLLLSANHESKKWQGIEIKRGQLVTGRKSLSKATGISERSIRTCLEMLKTTSELTIKTTNKYSIITICKYEDYQELKSISDQQSDQQKANKRPATDHKQEEEEVKEEKILFDHFWDSYHEITKRTKTDKEAAQKYWKKLKEPEKEKAVEMIKPYFDSLSDTKYCKKARTYLADKNFNDEYTINKRGTVGTSSGNSFGHQGGLKENPNWHDPRLPREVE